MGRSISFKNGGSHIILYAWMAIMVCAFWNLTCGLYAILGLLVLTLFYIAFFQSEKKIVVRTIDAAIIFAGISEVINYALSSYQPNTFVFLTRLIVVLASYTVYTMIANADADRLLKISLAGYGTLLGIATFFFFLLFRSAILEEGFTDIANFKHLYAPFGQISNDWSSVLLIFLAFNTYLFIQKTNTTNKSEWWSGIGIIFLLFSIMVAFSRGIYLATFAFFAVIFFALIFFKIFTLKQASRNVVHVALVVMSLVILIREPVFQTVQANQSTSQKRSVAGRIAVWENTAKMISDNAITGIGSGNFSLYYTSYKGNSIDAAYTTRVNNTFIQILVEKGLLGVIAYGVLFGYAIYTLLRHLRSKNIPSEEKIFHSVMLALFVALAIKELTFSSFFEQGGLMLLIFLICALTRSGSSIVYSSIWSVRQRTALSLGTLVALTFFGIKFYQVQAADQLNSEAIAALYSKHYDEGIFSLDKAIALSPKQALYHIHKAVMLENDGSANISSANDSVKYSQFIPTYSNKENRAKAIAHYEKALALNPKDDRAHHNISWLFFSAGNTVKALNHLKIATVLESSEAIYWLSMGIVLDQLHDEKQSDQAYLNALVQSPELIQSVFWSSFYTQDSQRAKKLLQLVNHTLQVSSNDNIIARAKYASVLSISKPDSARLLLEAINSELPNLGRAWLNLGRLYFKDHKVKDGIICIKRAILLDKNDYHAVQMLADYFNQIKRYKEAIIYYKRTLQMQVNAKSQYDGRVGKMYETMTALQTFSPNKLWSAARCQYSLSALCSKLSELYNRGGNKIMSSVYKDLSKKDFLFPSDLPL